MCNEVSPFCGDKRVSKMTKEMMVKSYLFFICDVDIRALAQQGVKHFGFCLKIGGLNQQLGGGDGINDSIIAVDDFHRPVPFARLKALVQACQHFFVHFRLCWGAGLKFYHGFTVSNYDYTNNNHIARKLWSQAFFRNSRIARGEGEQLVYIYIFSLSC